MKKRKYISLLLLFVSMLMLAVNLVPHHHHYHNGMPCFHSIEKEAQTTDNTSAKPHSCSCIDSFYAAENQGHTHHEAYCNHFPAMTLLTDLITYYLFIPDPICDRVFPIYVESLHDTHVLCDFGLRAPPVLA